MRTCPKCKEEFRQAKIKGGKEIPMRDRRWCPECDAQLYYRPKDTILYEDYKVANSMVRWLEEHIATRDGVEFVFDGPCRVQQLATAYLFIARIKAFLALQRAAAERRGDLFPEIDTMAFAEMLFVAIIHSVGHIVQSLGLVSRDISVLAKDTWRRYISEWRRSLVCADVQSHVSGHISYAAI